MVTLFYRFPRKYTETLGRSYTDGSRWLHERIRGVFLRGQQLWDQDLNDALKVWALWRPRDVIYRKYRNRVSKPPYYSPIVESYIIDPAHSGLPDANAEDTLYYNSVGMPYPYYLPPLPGWMVYVKADRNFVAYTGAQWLPVLKIDTRDVDVEVAIFMSIGAVKKDAVCAVYTVEKAFAITAAGARQSRARGVNDNAGFKIRKNGVVVANIIVVPKSSKIQIKGDTAFAVGDRLEIYATPTATFTAPVSVTILGKLLDV